MIWAEGVGRFPSGIHPESTSRSSSLCTFPEKRLFRAWLRITILHNKWRAGFPEFTRFFNHDFSWKLQPAVNLSMTIRTKQNTLVKFLGNLLPASSVAFVRDSEVLSIRLQMVEL